MESAEPEVKMEPLDELIDDLNEIETRFPGHWDLENKYNDKKIAKIFTDAGDNNTSKMEELMLACLRSGNSVALDKIAERMLERRKLIDWKSKPDFVNKCFETIKENALIPDERRRHYTSFVEKLITLLKTLQILDRHADVIFSLTEASLTSRDAPELAIHSAALPCVTKFPWTDHPDKIQRVIKLLLELVKYNPDLCSNAWQCSTAGMIMCMVMRGASGGAVVKVRGRTISDNEQQGSTIHELILDDISEMFNFCANQEWQCSDDPSKNNISFEVCKSILEDFLRAGSTSAPLVKPMIASIKELYECGDEILQRDAGYIMTAMAGEPELTGDYTQQFLEQFLDGKLPALMSHVLKLYELCPEKFTPLLSRFTDYLRGPAGMGEKMMTVQVFGEMAKKEPHLMNSEICDAMHKLLDDEQQKYMALMFFSNLSDVEPAMVQPYDKTLIKMMHAESNISLQSAGILVKIATNETLQRKYLKEMATFCIKTTVEVTKLCIVSNMRTIGLKSPLLLAEYRKMFEDLRHVASLTDICQSAIDVIDGRSLEGVAQTVELQDKDIKQLDKRVTTTDKNVTNLKKNVTANTKDIAKVKTDVKKQEEKLDELKEVVDVTVDKVEDLDHKTLSHAPAWSREVARLLNPAADHDWRLLASRLGYSNDDIRNWATQPDPCLSMFDEWFATHKTREATYGVLKTLVEMDRTDASVIVDKALEAVANIVDEDDDEPAVPPPVFLSYQWAHQPEVKLLKRHLGNAGYSCWMDVGQMGGGDKLFAKIDAGIRAAKVIVCCVTSKYAESPNCNREVNLAVTLGKPIIPLQVEKMSWPPPGAMGPIFGEYIFVRFFQRPGEETKDDRYWPEPKFTELLMQLRYTIAPEVSLITEDSPYRNWWEPPEEIIVIKPKQQNQAAVSGASTGQVSKSDQAAASPDVFISYQWDKQSQIKELYRKLTSLGYTCWLDIMQMGGGDSLYDKIDRGVRGCRVVVSCVTSKYAISANCRREVSLADAIKKPIVPLKLDSKMTWPPEGPMSMVFTQLVYINFCKPNEDVQNNWNCPQFTELIDKMKQHLDIPPNVPRAPAAPPTPQAALPSSQPPPPPPPPPSTTVAVKSQAPASVARSPSAASGQSPKQRVTPTVSSSSQNVQKEQVKSSTQQKSNSSSKMQSAIMTRSVQDIKQADSAGNTKRRGSLPTTPTTRACVIL